MTRLVPIVAALMLVVGCSSLDFGRFTAGPSLDGGTDSATDTGLRDADDDDADTSVDTGGCIPEPETCNNEDEDCDEMIDEHELEDGLCGDSTLACVAGACAPAPKALSANGKTTCILMTDGHVYCWGWNEFGQAGGESTTSEPSPVLVTKEAGEDFRASAISSSEDHTCAIEASTMYLHCWGNHRDGLLATFDGIAQTLQAHQSETDTSTPIPAEQVATGLDFTLASAGTTIFAAGQNDFRQLGDGSDLDQIGGAIQYMDASITMPITSLTAGAHHACALSETTAYCWGDHTQRQTGSMATTFVPTPIAAVEFSQVDAGAEHTCGVATDATVRCWGNNDRSQLGVVSGESRAIPVMVAANAKMVSAGGTHTCMVDLEGAVSCWGSNDFGQLGRPDDEQPESETPVAVDMGAERGGALALAAGDEHTCAITTRRIVVCWGANGSNQCGPDAGSAEVTPVPVRIR